MPSTWEVGGLVGLCLYNGVLKQALHPASAAFPLNTDAVMGMDSVHGDTYEWIPDFFKFNHINANMTMERIIEEYPGLTIIEHPELVRRCRGREKASLICF